MDITADLSPFLPLADKKKSRVEMFLMGVYNDLKRSGAKSYVRKEHGRMFSNYMKKSFIIYDFTSFKFLIIF